MLIRRATSAVAGVSPATTTADSGGAPCARYGAPFDVRFAPTGSWEEGASKEISDSSWGGRSCRRRALLRLPELGQSRGGVTEHGRRRCGCLRFHAIVLITMVGSGTSCGGCGHGHAMAGGEKLSAAVGDGARGRERRGRAQERQRRLTADPFEAETRPGMVRSRRIERR